MVSSLKVVLILHSVEVIVIEVILLVVVVLSVSQINVQLARLEYEILLTLGQHLHGVTLVVVGDKAVALRVAHGVRDDTGILDGTKVGKVLSKLVLRGLRCLNETKNNY